MANHAAVPFDAVIFDLDGTLNESEPGIVNCVQYALDALGRTDYTRDLLRKFIGPPLYEAFMANFDMDSDTAVKGVQIYRERYREIGWKENAVYRGIPLLLKSLKENGVYVAMATSKPELFANQIAEYFGFRKYFDRIEAVSMTEMQHSDKAALIARALPKEYRRACMVGDRMFDIEGGLKINIEAVGALYGYGSRGELTNAGATHIAETVEELTDYLLCGRPRARGMFLAVEGVDGCGKSTQIEKLNAWLNQCGHDVIRTREPGGSPMAEKIRDLLLDVNSKDMTGLCEAYLFAASRAQHVHDTILPGIEDGKLVLCDRYVASSIAYQGAGRGLGVERIEAINREATKDCMPDVTLVFDLDVKTATGRVRQAGAPDRIESEDNNFHERVREGFQRLWEREPDRIRRIDADGTPDEVAERARAILMEALG